MGREQSLLENIAAFKIYIKDIQIINKMTECRHKVSSFYIFRRECIAEIRIYLEVPQRDETSLFGKPLLGMLTGVIEN